MEQQFLYLYFNFGHQARLGQVGQSLGARPGKPDILRIEDFPVGHMSIEVVERTNLEMCLELSVA